MSLMQRSASAACLNLNAFISYNCLMSPRMRETFAENFHGRVANNFIHSFVH